MKIQPYNGSYLATANINGVPLFVMHHCRSTCVQRAIETAWALSQATKKPH